jgi:hypothetical protein
LREMQGRQQTQQELERLAQQLREAGSQVVNAGTAGEAMEALNEPPDSPGQKGSQETEGKPQAQGEQGLAQAQEASQAVEAGTGQQGQTPPPGAGGAAGPQLSLGEANPNAGRGGEKPGEGPPMLMAPVPGQKPGDDPPETTVFVQGDGAKGGSKPGAGSGLRPGAGTRDIKGEETAVLESGKSVMATAQQGGEGASTVRQVEGGALREEKARQESAALSAEFMEAQEAAMDEIALPAARREQVRRYFNALRKRLEGGGEVKSR